MPEPQGWAKQAAWAAKAAEEPEEARLDGRKRNSIATISLPTIVSR